MNKKKLIMILIGVVSLVASFILLLLLTIPTVKEDSFSFSSTYKDKEVTLKASYYPAKDASYAALICPGYSCDREKWRPMADMLVSEGISTMTFDYAGQGASSSTIGFDNAKTDAIPKEIDDAIMVLHEKSNIEYDHIILIGHSMGGRSILRLLYDYNNPKAETKVTKKDIKNVILLSPEVNYEYNAQASLFAGTSDSEDAPWKEFSSLDTLGTHVYLIGSTGDDIVKDEDVWAITNRIDDSTITSGKNTYSSSLVTTTVVGGVLHSYMMYSSKIAKVVDSYIGQITNSTTSYNTSYFSTIYISWILGLIGLLLVLLSLTEGKEFRATDCTMTLTNERQFLLRKLLMWLPATGFAVLICCFCVVVPFGSPIMNTPYMCFIAGYGIWMVICYRKGTFKGTIGKLPKISFKIKTTKKDMLELILIGLALLFFVWYALWATMYRLLPFNTRLFWVLFAGVLMGIGYYVSSSEVDMLKNNNASKKCIFFYNIIQYVPLFLLIAFYAVIKSYSGMIGQAQNMLLMYIFCVPFGNYIKIKTQNRLYGAFSTALLFQALMITSAALISMF